MSEPSTGAYPFGDLLALARQSWLGQLASRLATLGYPGYVRSDAAAIRLLSRGPAPVGALGTVLGVTRQAARKAAGSLQERGYVTLARGTRDTRQVDVTLTPVGHAYARAVTAVIEELNREVAQRAGPAKLTVADAVLRAALFDDGARQRASTLPRPASPASPPG